MLFLALAPLRAETLTTSLTTPYVDHDTASFLSFIQYDGSFLDAERASLDIFHAERTNWTLTGLTATPGFFRFDAAVLETPPYAGEPSFDKTSLAFMSSGISKTVGKYSFSLLASSFFLPEIATTIQSQKFSMEANAVPGFAGTVRYGDFSFMAFGFKGTVYGNVEQTRIGQLETSAYLLAGNWKDFGLFYFSFSGNSAFSAYAMITNTLGFAGTIEGNAHIQGGGGWGEARFRKGAFGGSIWAGFALLQSKDSSINARYSIDTKMKLDAKYALEWNPASVLLANARIDYQPARRIMIEYGRWFFYQSKNIPATTIEPNRESSGISGNNEFLQEFKSLDWQTLVFAGSSLSIKCELR